MTEQPAKEKDLQQQREYYNERWANEKYASKGGMRRASAIIDLLAQTGLKHPRILDYGCGRGWLSSILSTFGPTSAFDLSDAAIERAKQRWPWIDFRAGNALDAQFEPQSFDVVVSQEVIEHVDDQAMFLERIAELLKPGGYLILTTPNEFLMKNMNPKTRKRWKDQPIENRLHKKELLALIAENFTTKRFGSTTLQYGKFGIYQLINLKILRSILKTLHLTRLWEMFWLSHGYGLHFHILAKKKRL